MAAEAASATNTRDGAIGRTTLGLLAHAGVDEDVAHQVRRRTGRVARDSVAVLAREARGQVFAAEQHGGPALHRVAADPRRLEVPAELPPGERAVAHLVDGHSG